MEFWFHCNKCARRPESRMEIPSFHLTSCGHILCSQCFGSTDTVKVCIICQRAEIVTHAVDETLPPHIKKFFMPPKVLIERAEKRIKETITFQHSQKILMERCLVVQLWYQLQTAKKDSEIKNQLEIEIARLKNGLKCLKGELLRTLNNHREFEKQALQWGFKTLSVKGCGQSFPKEQDALQATEMKIGTENSETFANNANIVADDSSVSSEISDEPLDLSVKGKVGSVNERILSCPSSNSNLAKCTVTPFNIVTSAVPTKKYQSTGLQMSRTQRNAVSLHKLHFSGNGSTRRKYYRLQNSDRIPHPRPRYEKWSESVAFPVLTSRGVRASVITETRIANNEG